jgi:hypothetical protein
MSLLTDLQDEMKAAMKAHDQRRLDALRLMVSAIRYVQIDTPDMTDEQMVNVLVKEGKKRNEAIEAYRNAGRTEQEEQEKYELSVIEGYLPKMMGEEELRVKVSEVMAANKFESFGAAMNAVMKTVGKSADGAMVAKLVREMYK